MPSDVDQLHFLALSSANVLQDIEVLEAAPDVVCVVHAVSRVATRRSPVGGVALQGLHPGQCLR